ncbi:MAG: LeuA family protein [Thermoprotei archaeon]
MALKPFDKLKIAQALDELGVDIIEAGFPSSSKSEAEAVKLIKKNTNTARIAALTRALKSDIDIALSTDADIIHVFIATSEIHMKYKLKMSKEEVVNSAITSVEYIKEHGAAVMFSAEDATRSDPNFLITIYKEVLEAGADILNVPDTVGVMTPEKMANLIQYIRKHIGYTIPIDVHCHNDFGLAVANTIAAIQAGADGAQVVANGYGERAGNAALEEVVAILHFLIGYKTNIKTNLLKPTSRLISSIFGIPIPPNKPIIGDNAFSHESGIHVHGVLNNPLTYEPITPEIVGSARKIVLGKKSGKRSVEYALKNMGIEPDEKLVNFTLEKIKELSIEGIKINNNALKNIINEFYKNNIT